MVQAQQDLIDRLNAEIEQGNIRNLLGQQVTRRVDAGLVTEDGSLLCPIRNEIVTLVADELIELEQV